MLVGNVGKVFILEIPIGVEAHKACYIFVYILPAEIILYYMVSAIIIHCGFIEGNKKLPDLLLILLIRNQNTHGSSTFITNPPNPNSTAQA